MIPRPRHVKEIARRLRNFEVVAILGPRQIGKTTLARQVAEHHSGRFHHFDLEDPAALSRLVADANLALRSLKGLVVIDEVQRLPNLFPLLRVLADPPAAAGEVPGSGQRVARSPPAILRVPGRPDQLLRVEWPGP